MVQILVVVAITQARTLRAEVEKGFSRTALARELVDPKLPAAATKRSIGREPGSHDRAAKGNWEPPSQTRNRNEGGDANETAAETAAAAPERVLFSVRLDVGPGIASSGGGVGVQE